MTYRILSAIAALTVLIPSTALAQSIEPPLPCPWWHCDGPTEVVVEEYSVETTIDDSIATTRITQILRNDGRMIAEGEFLHPVPADAAVTGLTLWIDGEAVTGDLLDGDAARRTYEEIVRRTLDPALLEFVDDGLLRLSVFPIPAGESRKVEIEYRQILPNDGGCLVGSFDGDRVRGGVDRLETTGLDDLDSGHDVLDFDVGVFAAHCLAVAGESAVVRKDLAVLDLDLEAFPGGDGEDG